MAPGGVDWLPLYRAVGQARIEPRPDRRALARARQLIDDAYDRELALDRIAATAGYSPDHFARRYAAVYGTTPMRALTHRRMLAARELLATTQWSVTDVCVRVGFASLGSFSDRFRRQFGVTPTAFRRRVWRLEIELGSAARIPTCFLARYAAG